MMILASIIWIPAIRKPFPNQIQGMVPLLICLFVFTVNPMVGTALGNAIAGINGTFWACFHMWFMNGIFPGGMKEGMSPTSACAIFGWANFLIFLWLTLWCKCGLGTKMFFLATHIGFMLAFLNPASTLPFSENFTISMKGTAVNTMIATCLGTLSAPLMNLLPYPMSFAYTTMKGNAVKASTDTAKLFTFIIDYYCGSEGSVVVESCVKHAGDLRAELDGMGGPIGAAWFEGFDLGTRGTVRALMESHLGLMNDVYDKLRAILIVVRSEDFGPSHTAIASKIHDSAMRVALATKKLMIAVTEAATDGDISSKEKAELSSLVLEAKAAVKALAKDFDGARKALKVAVSEDLLGENYFVLTISAYARLVIDYSEMMMNSPPQATGLGTVMVNWLKSTWDFGAMTDKFNLSFAIVHYIAIIFCWLFSVYVDNWGGGCVITAVFLMSPAVCPDVQAFLNVLSAVMVAVIWGTLIYQWTCGSGFGNQILPFAAFVFWIIGLYGYFSGSVFLLPCLLFVARLLSDGFRVALQETSLPVPERFGLAWLQTAWTMPLEAFARHSRHSGTTRMLQRQWGLLLGTWVVAQVTRAVPRSSPASGVMTGRKASTWILRAICKRSALTSLCCGSPWQAQMENQMAPSPSLMAVQTSRE